MNDRYIPTIFSGVSKKRGRPKSMSRHDSLSPDTKRAGRPSNIEQQEAFMKVIEGMSDKSDTQQFLLVDLVKEMQLHLADTGVNAYCKPTMKTKLLDTYGTAIIITHE